MLVNDRVISTDGDFGTIRYVGNVPAWGSAVAYGIEWDNAKRGKNDGTLLGIRYFQTSNPTSGSFIKGNSAKLDSKRSTFVSAMLRQYGSSEIQEEISFGTKTTESLGFEKLSKIQSDFGNLKVVSLQRRNIDIASAAKEELEAQLDLLQNLVSLDLGYNLINDLNQVWQIVDSLENLQELTLNGNKFTNNVATSTPLKTCINLKALHLIDTKLSLVCVGEILQKFPNIETLTISSNGYRDDDVDPSIFPSTLKVLDFSFNELTKVPDLHNFKVVNLSNNRITHCSQPLASSKVEALDIRYNSIDSWHEIDLIYRAFPSLLEIRINGNPILEDLSIDDMTTNLIARFHCTHERTGQGISKLNGTYLSKDEITNAELYFIAMVQKGTYKNNLQSTRWPELIKKYGIEEVTVENKPELTILQSNIIPLQIVIEGVASKRNFLKTNTVLKVKGIIGRMLKVPVTKIQLKCIISEVGDGAAHIERIMDDNFAILDSYDLERGQRIYIEIV